MSNKYDMINKESVTFTLKFSSKHTGGAPQVIVSHNGVNVTGVVTIDPVQDIQFLIDLPTDCVQPCQLVIDRTGFDGMTEQLLTLDEIWIDDINVGVLCHQSRYYPVYPEPWISQQRDQGHDWLEFHHGWVTWGWNGRWVLDYETPIYTWMLKNV